MANSKLFPVNPNNTTTMTDKQVNHFDNKSYYYQMVKPHQNQENSVNMNDFNANYMTNNTNHNQSKLEDASYGVTGYHRNQGYSYQSYHYYNHQASHDQHSGRPRKEFCSWCFKGGRQCNHRLKDSQGKIICPDLLTKQCQYCFDYGHFMSHCPMRTQKQNNFNPSNEANTDDARTLHNSLPETSNPLFQTSPTSNASLLTLSSGCATMLLPPPLIPHNQQFNQGLLSPFSSFPMKGPFPGGRTRASFSSASSGPLATDSLIESEPEKEGFDLEVIEDDYHVTTNLLDETGVSFPGLFGISSSLESDRNSQESLGNNGYTSLGSFNSI